MNIEVLSDKECIICLDNKEIEWITLECRHEYHKKCIHDWMRVRMICPICVRIICPPEDTQIVIEPPEDIYREFYEYRQRERSPILCSILLITIICILIGTLVAIYS
jgi:hypothetical protein